MADLGAFVAAQAITARDVVAAGAIDSLLVNASEAVTPADRFPVAIGHIPRDGEERRLSGGGGRTLLANVIGARDAEEQRIGQGRT